MRISLPHSMALLLALCAWQFCPAYEVRVQSSTCGSAQSYTVDADAALTVLATADVGYHFVQWEDGSSTNPRTLTVSSDTTLTATFAEDSGSGGANKKTILLYGADCQTPMSYEFAEGATINLIANPTEGYMFTQWSDSVTSNPRTITVTDNAEFHAEFESYGGSSAELKEIIIGTNSCDTVGIYRLPLGAELTLVAQLTDSVCSTFDKWENNVTTSVRTDTITGHATYTATFGKIQYTITAISDDASQGTTIVTNE